MELALGIVLLVIFVVVFVLLWVTSGSVVSWGQRPTQEVNTVPLFTKREQTTTSIVQSMLEAARQWPLGSMERSNILAEANLLVQVEIMNKNTTLPR